MCAIDFGELLDLSWNTSWYFCYALSPGQTIATCQRSISQHCWVQHVACVWPPCCDVLRHVGCCWLKFDQLQAPAKRSQHANATYRNIVGRNMLRAFGHRVAMCCDMLGVVGSSLKMVKFEPTTSNMPQRVATLWPNAPNNVAICCVGMLRSFGQGFMIKFIVNDNFYSCLLSDLAHE